jgi:hypothetical protein
MEEESMILFKTNLAGFDVTLERNTKKEFTVRYGEQHTEHLGWNAAAEELGLCILHALQREGKLD